MLRKSRGEYDELRWQLYLSPASSDICVFIASLSNLTLPCPVKGTANALHLYAELYTL